MDEQARIRWLREKIYVPRERIRARQLADGNWEVFDGTKVITVNGPWFKDNYWPAACNCKFNKEHDQYEYHTH